MNQKIKHIVEELREHLPYTIFSVSLGLIGLGLLTFISILLTKDNFPQAANVLFHVFHPLHMLFSATATTAMFWRHEKKLLKAAFIGLFGAIVICSASDILIPFISGHLLGIEMHFHLCLLEHPEAVIPFLGLGIFVGLLIPKNIKSTLFSHSAHVLISSMASILYLVSFGLIDWVHVIGGVFLLVILAVMIPCCISDIVFPLLFTKKEEQTK